MAAASPMPAELDTRLQKCDRTSCPPTLRCCYCDDDDSVCIRGTKCPACR
ncbi:hypothetical protein ISF_01751 [Cordyceps fumosorosea ARSEF 2679]|uniref:Uncharacterized protein n=1 Tax=Cordyceps fumosorosea (strain ARSEF 2679) TaxID=1081104 RepID=A0A168CBU5_CORFA|nr:hypothetical protein ISF_01751 [Cordyceps fumosorosea ARSEF 2679]OAA71200.1 hypothetical protein ISF_01751 [Cordyceps fumosorosea ARSEF 2679]